MSASVQELLLEEASAVIAEKMGVYFPRQRLKDLERAFSRAAKELGYTSLEACLGWFLEEPLTREKTDTLAGFITVGETYFFRESQCFEVLEQEILPELVRKRRRGAKRLRIWSAGCATGEEPYSIAIMLHRMQHLLKDWEISILATDINMQALQRAMKGEYSPWSFRNTPDWLRKNYFRPSADGRLAVIPEIRRMVNFTYLNLAEDLYPSVLNETNALDIIFCRNVLMYFSPERIRETLERFNHCLLDEGWMIVSSCETSNLLSSSFSAVYYPDIILYRKMGHRPATERSRESLPVLPPLPMPMARPVPEKAPAIVTQAPRKAPAPMAPENTPSLQEARKLCSIGQYRAAEEHTRALLQRNEHDGEALVLLCRIYANEGRLEDALRLAERALAQDKLNAGNYYLHAMILLEQDKKDEAAASLKRALYLNHNHASAHFMLGTLARATGQPAEAKKHLHNALSILEKSDPQEAVEDSEGLQAGKLAEMIRITLNNT